MAWIVDRGFYVQGAQAYSPMVTVIPRADAAGVALVGGSHFNI